MTVFLFTCKSWALVVVGHDQYATTLDHKSESKTGEALIISSQRYLIGHEAMKTS